MFNYIVITFERIIYIYILFYFLCNFCNVLNILSRVKIYYYFNLASYTHWKNSVWYKESIG